MLEFGSKVLVGFVKNLYYTVLLHFPLKTPLKIYANQTKIKNMQNKVSDGMSAGIFSFRNSEQYLFPVSPYYRLFFGVIMRNRHHHRHLDSHQ